MPLRGLFGRVISFIGIIVTGLILAVTSPILKAETIDASIVSVSDWFYGGMGHGPTPEDACMARLAMSGTPVSCERIGVESVNISLLGTYISAYYGTTTTLGWATPYVYTLLLRPDEFLSCILDATVLEVTHNPLGILFQHQHMGAGCIA